MDLVNFIFYVMVGLIIHVILLYWIIKGKHLKWPEGILTASILSLGLYIIHFYFWFLIILFFSSSSILTRYRIKDKHDVHLLFDKGGERDTYQILANSFGILFFALVQLLNGIQTDIDLVIILGAAIFVASVNSDTWATEIGILSTTTP
ncbi:MAG: DUF92 domain-containing protein, partial [Candidatus Hodarchaeales archaeon]